MKNFDNPMNAQGLANKLDEAYKYAKGEPKIAVLWGAGCSVTANIPICSGILEQIEANEEYQHGYRKAKDKYGNREPIYAEVMEGLTDLERIKFIRSMVSSAKINWASLLLAQLIRSGYVSRVLTTNFDPLIAKSCALLDVDVAVYDFAASPTYVSKAIADPAIFHLHGQHYGFFLKNTKPETADQAKAVNCLFDDMKAEEFIWIVVGYSGRNDELFDELVGSGGFKKKLYWCYQRDHLEESVLKKLQWHNTIGVEIEGADELAVVLTRQLNIFPPDLIQKPFTHFNGVISKFSPLDFMRAGLQPFPLNMLLEGTFRIENSESWESIRRLLTMPEPNASTDIDQMLECARTAFVLNWGRAWVPPLVASCCIQAGEFWWRQAIRERAEFDQSESSMEPEESEQQRSSLVERLDRAKKEAHNCYRLALNFDPQNELARELLERTFPALPMQESAMYATE